MERSGRLLETSTAMIVTKNQTEQLPRDVADLAAAVERLPAEHRLPIDSLMYQVIQSSLRRRRILELVQEALSQLRLDMKYLVFDLEATRRERDELKGK
jgi:hypothetical protein